MTGRRESSRAFGVARSTDEPALERLDGGSRPRAIRAAGLDGGRPVRILEADPDLARHLEPDQLREAASASAVHVQCLPAGTWMPANADYDERGLGLLIVDGFIQRRVVLTQRSSTELLGNGDLIRPWQRDDAYAVPVDVRWRVYRDTHIAGSPNRTHSTSSLT